MYSAAWVKEERPTLPFPKQDVSPSKDELYTVFQPPRPKKHITRDMDSDNYVPPTGQPNAATRATSIPELLETILLNLLSTLHLLTEQEDPRSVRVDANARTLIELLHCTEVSRSWHKTILASGPLKRALFLLPDRGGQRSWRQQKRLHSSNSASDPSGGRTATKAPDLNPMIQTALPAYHFRFWNLEQSHHCAYLILTRSTLPALTLRARTGQGATLSRMQLAQPPVQCLRATIFPVRDEAHIEQVGVTRVLSRPELRWREGVTLGMVHEWVSGLLERHRDVAGVKITTESHACADGQSDDDDNDPFSDAEVSDLERPDEFAIDDDGSWLRILNLAALRGSCNYVMGTRDGGYEGMRPTQRGVHVIAEFVRTGGWELKWSTRDGEPVRAFARTSPGSANEIVSFAVVAGNNCHTWLQELDRRGLHGSV